MTAIPKITKRFETSLASALSAAGSSFTLESATDEDGNALSGLYGITIDVGSSNVEDFVVTISGSTATVVYRGIDADDPITEVTANKKAHRSGAPVVITDYPILAFIRNILNGESGYTLPNLLKYATGIVPVSPDDLTDKAYVDGLLAGIVTTVNVVVPGTAGETVAAGNLIYFDDADNEWKKCDADIAATVENTLLGIAQGAGVDGGTISGGVILRGMDANQAGLTAGAVYYASNTAGAISSSAGTKEVSVGFAYSTTQLYFNPRFNQQITEDEQDALVGTSGTPSSSNKFVTNDDVAATATASKVARRNATGDVTVPATPTAPTDAASKGYVDASDAALNRVVGVGLPTASKTYHNFVIPYAISTDVPTSNFWDTAGDSSFAGSMGSVVLSSAGSDATKSILTTRSIWNYVGSDSDLDLKFDTGKDVIVEFIHQCNAVGVEQLGWGLSSSNAPFIDYDDQTVDAACFTVDAAGALFAHTGNAGAGHTETPITGITLTNKNVYRIEFNPGVDVKFYVNGILRFFRNSRGSFHILWSLRLE
jgi:hypothetical protein